MNDTTHDPHDGLELDARLERAIRWTDAPGAAEPAPWQAALDAAADDRQLGQGIGWLLSSRHLGAAAAIAVGLGAIVVALQLTSPVRSARDAGVARAVAPLDEARLRIDRPERESAAPAAAGPTTIAADRAIAHSVSMTLRVEDVRAAFLLASRMASAAHGEHVEGSTLTGDGPTMHGTVTLRVRPDRLDTTLNALRELGRVADEKRTSDDLTTDLVDLEAQLRNERAIEAELLELLKRRENAPLDEILKLRESLSRVRSSIERLDGRRSAIDRVVTLASITVVIRPEVVDPEPPPPAEPDPLATKFREGIATAFRDGMSTLLNSCAFLVRVAIGGLPWWLAGVALLPLALRRMRPAPRLATDGA